MEMPITITVREAGNALLDPASSNILVSLHDTDGKGYAVHIPAGVARRLVEALQGELAKTGSESR